ncbi:methyltransferase domain-containing protein [archaeon]|nr:methyltransferase domain-containing protein [archaeon]
MVNATSFCWRQLKLNYAWTHLKNVEKRGRILFNALKPYLKQGDNILDVNCGYSPMAEYFIKEGYSILGFDIHPEPIQQLRQNHPKGIWTIMPDTEANFKLNSVFLLLGVTTPLYPMYSKTFLKSLKHLVKLNKPRVILLESADGADQRLYKETCDWLIENCYTKRVSERYEAKISRASKRHYTIWTRGWYYPYWNKLFREAEDLDEIHERFYKAAGIKLSSLTLYDQEKIIFPKLYKTKDQFVKDLILSKSNIHSILVVGFWDARFAFYMGLKGFYVDGVECYKRAVEVAKKAQETLPTEIARRFNFSYGLAENLNEKPKYDVIVNFCLEHVKDPKLVMNEALKHLKHDGYAYFTPPIGHGCDSPTHLHHFQEADILNLLPKNYAVNIYAVKFMAASPKPNCFVVEVFHK